jgi:hypothetical protein
LKRIRKEEVQVEEEEEEEDETRTHKKKRKKRTIRKEIPPPRQCEMRDITNEANTKSYEVWRRVFSMKTKQYLLQTTRGSNSECEE